MPRLFRIAAIAEAITWVLLLAAMFGKYVTESQPFGIREGGVPVAGAIHGGVFVVYVLVALATARVQRWSLPVTIGALVAGIPPLATVVFERWAERRDLLADPAPVTT